ncbi:flagellar biosynthetic protein FliR [bacterium]|nr:flagellar biosynthetic protein FliR [bacterium]
MTASALEEYLSLEVVSLFLVFMRIYGLVLFMPIFSSQTLPVTFRFYLVFAISILLVPTVSPPVAFASSTMVSMGVTMMGELAVGAVIGSLVHFVFSALQLAGQVAGTQLGLALAGISNPQFDDQAATTSVVYATIASLAFFITGLDREVFRILLDTFQVIPLGQVAVEDSLLPFVLSVFGQSMILAVRIAAPVTIALFLAELAMAFVGRTVPQLNILSIGFSVRIMLGLMLTLAGLSEVGDIFCDYLVDAMAQVTDTLDQWLSIPSSVEPAITNLVR